MKRPTIKIALLPAWPVCSSIAQHYAPAWIDTGVWIWSGIFGIIALFLSFIPWEEL